MKKSKSIKLDARIRRAAMTYSAAEKQQLQAIALATGRSESDVLRHAVNIAYGFGWPVPLWRKSGAVKIIEKKVE